MGHYFCPACSWVLESKLESSWQTLYLLSHLQPYSGTLCALMCICIPSSQPDIVITELDHFLDSANHDLQLNINDLHKSTGTRG